MHQQTITQRCSKLKSYIIVELDDGSWFLEHSSELTAASFTCVSSIDFMNYKKVQVVW